MQERELVAIMAAIISAGRKQGTEQAVVDARAILVDVDRWQEAAFVAKDRTAWRLLGKPTRKAYSETLEGR